MATKEKKHYPQPYRFEIAKAKFKRANGTFTIHAPEGVNEEELDLITQALELFSDVEKHLEGKK
jgi:hypothetical protein